MTISSIFYAVLFALLVSGSASLAQNADPLSFFPHHVGDRWDYVYSDGGFRGPLVLTRDSLGSDGSHNLMYNDATDPNYRIDATLRVYKYPQEPNYNYLRYRLGADSCDSWENPAWGAIRWAWVARVESSYVFGRRTVVKVYRYGPGPGPSGLEEDWLASGFGLIYTYRHPNEISYLRGCVIAGDTFGILTSTPRVERAVAREYVLKQNYPNPFNPSTTVLLSLPERSTLSLRVFDLLGKEVEMLAEGTYDGGVHRFLWNASHLPSGVYFCRMQAK